MADWMLRCADILIVICHLLKQRLLQQRVINADETTLQVIHEDKTKCYMWVYCTGTDSPNPDSDIPNIVLYDYQASHAGQCAVDFLEGYDGYLQVDGYAGYEQTQAKLVGCFAHARRKFMEAKQAQSKGNTGKADWALNHLQKLYRLEKLLQGKSPEEKFKVRQEKALPLLNEFKAWLDKSSLRYPEKSSLRKAIKYSLNQWTKLVRYVEDGHLNIDNNRAERAVKPFVIGRKNWLFSNTANGANASAVLYSLIETAKANGLTPYDYLCRLLTELPRREPKSDLSDLLPWQ